MDNLGYLPDVILLLGVSVLVVVLFKRLSLSPVLGYLIAGAVIGEYGFNLIKEPHYTHAISEFGVVFLLFAIGLELTIERLVKMRLHVFGFGGLQMILTTVCLSAVFIHYFQLKLSVAIIVGAALALSSTAIVLQVLAENKRQATQVGRLSLSILLLQDFAVVPLLAILPIMASAHDNVASVLGLAALKAFAAIILITIGGRLFLRPFFSIIGSAKSEEVYVTTTLVIVLGAAFLTGELGLSTAMGAFVAGLLIAETEYRNRVEMSIMPFKSLLLGLFFLSVGMSIDAKFIVEKLADVLLAAGGLLMLKGIIVYVLCKAFRFPNGASIHSALLVSQGGEFAFILFSLAAKQNVMEPAFAQFLLMVVSISMAVTPLLSILGSKIEDAIDSKESLDSNQEFKGVSDLDSHVIIAGFGRVGRMIAFMLTHEKINYIAVDSSVALVKKGREQGFPVYHGDLSKIDTLRAVGAERANSIILTMDEKVSLRRAVKLIHTHYKDLKIVTRVEDFRHGKGLKKLGASISVPSSIETGLQLGGALMKNLGIAEHDILALKEEVRNNDYSLTEDIELFRGIAPSKQTSST